MCVNQSGRYPRYRAPTGDGEILCRPDWPSIPGWLADNVSLELPSTQIAGKSLADLRTEARRSALAAALAYTRNYADVEMDLSPDTLLIATGHQPGLVHPGVWLKNFATAKLARQVGGVALSLIIDSDLCRSHALLVPTSSVESPRVENVPFDKAASQVPYEERAISDRDVWTTFGRRATKAISPLLSDPMLDEWWPKVACDAQEPNLGQALSRARHRLELSWNSTTLELPHSMLCRAEPFHRFAAHLLARAEEFCQAHNSALADYRREHHLRNLAQPVPDLHRENEWLETPFWIWSSNDPTRRPLFVQTNQDALRLSDRDSFSASLPVSEESLVEGLTELERRGVKLRTRALLTTMYARLILSDLFIHGIGGAKYDQVTDQICELFFGFCPPPFVTLTGTLRLPIPHPAAKVDRQRELQRILRYLRYHPEKEIDAADVDASRRVEFEELVAQKSRWVKTPKTQVNCAERHEAIASANLAMQSFAATRAMQVQNELDTLQNHLRHNRILDSREYSFCLFPRDKIQDFVLDFPPAMA